MEDKEQAQKNASELTPEEERVLNRAGGWISSDAGRLHLDEDRARHRDAAEEAREYAEDGPKPSDFDGKVEEKSTTYQHPDLTPTRKREKGK